MLPRLIVTVPLLLLGLVTPAAAQLPATRLGSVVPLSGNPGESLEVTIAGDDLDSASQLIFTHAGIKATQEMLEPGPFDKAPRPEIGTFVVSIAGNVPPGRYEVRTQGKYGLSNPRTFFVSTLPHAVEVEPNQSPDEATGLTLPVDLSGQLATGADVDYFQFQATASQRMILDCYARRADSAADAVVTVYDQAGRELASSRDAHRHDPLVDFQTIGGETYTIKLHDSAYRSGTDYAYRFTLGRLPHIDYVFPPAAATGGNRPFTLYGRNLPGGQPARASIHGRPLEKLAVNISLPAGSPAQGIYLEPASGALEAVAYRTQNKVGPSNSVMVGIASAPPVLEKEPNSAPSQAQTLTLPCEVMGRFEPERDHDWYTFSAQEGDRLAIEIISNRLGLATDPNLLIERIDPPAEGETEPQITQVTYLTDSETPDSGAEFPTANGDPVYQFTVEADGEYRLLVRDRENALRVDPRHVYRLLIRKAQPDFQLAAVPVDSYSSFLLRQGGRVGLRVVAFRREGFTGEIEVTATGLPAGVTCEKAIIGPARSAAMLTLTAAGNVKSGTANINVVGSSQLAGKAVKREALFATAIEPLSPKQNNRPQPPTASRLADRIVLSIVEELPAPAALSAGEGKLWETSRAGILKIPYTRSGSFKGKMELEAFDLPANVNPPDVTINPNQTSGEFELKLEDDTPVGTYTFHLAGIAEQVDYTRNPQAAATAAQRKKEVDAIVAEQTAAVKAATEAQALADKAAAEATAELAKAEAEHQQAEAALEKSTKAQAGLVEKLQAAKKAAASNAEDAALQAAVTAAEKAVADGEAQLKTATVAVTAAEKLVAESQTAVEETTAQQVTAAEAAQAAADLLEQATELKAETDQRAKQTADAAKPQKLNVPILSTPITLKVTPAPIELQPLTGKYQVRQGEKLEIPVALARKYGFNEEIRLDVQRPQGVAGVSIPRAQVEAKQAQGKLEVTANANATPGQQQWTLSATMRLNNQNLTVEETFTLTVLEVKQPEK